MSGKSEAGVALYKFSSRICIIVNYKYDGVLTPACYWKSSPRYRFKTLGFLFPVFCYLRLCRYYYLHPFSYLFAQLLCHIFNNVNKSGIIVQDYFSNNGQVDDQKRSVFLRTNRSVSKYSTYTMSWTKKEYRDNIKNLGLDKRSTFNSDHEIVI